MAGRKAEVRENWAAYAPVLAQTLEDDSGQWLAVVSDGKHAEVVIRSMTRGEDGEEMTRGGVDYFQWAKVEVSPALAKALANMITLLQPRPRLR